MFCSWKKNENLGKKLSITGGGHCNITNVEPDIRKWTEKFGEKGKFLLPALARFGVCETLEFFHGRNLPTKVEEGYRAFPKSERAEDVRDVVAEYLKETGVTVRYGSLVSGFEADGKSITGLKENGEILSARSFVLATGGKSRPETGSTGDGFRWLRALGHTIIEPDPSLVPVTVKESWIQTLQGLSFSDVRLSVWQNTKKHISRQGKLLFTHFGLSGPLALNMSQEIRSLFKEGPVTLSVDFFPGMDAAGVDALLLDRFSSHQNKQAKNSLVGLVPDALASVLVQRSLDVSDKMVNEITREERLRLGELLKRFELTVSGFLGYDKAIVTSGGMALEEVNFRTMQSRRYSNLYLVGDLLDFNRPSGGYSLQICWTSGRIAGEHAALAKQTL